MRFLAKNPALVFWVGLILSLIISFPSSAIGQAYPDKPITIYCAFAPGATTDLTARALAAGAEKLLGVPVVVENKPGGGATVAPALLVNKKPDGYTLCVTPSNSLTIRPHLYKLAYDPLKDFTYLVWYSLYLGGLCVNNDSPLKTIDEFISYAREHPGLSYGSSGTYSAQHLATELLAQCKGLKFRHVPTKGGPSSIPCSWVGIPILWPGPAHTYPILNRGFSACSWFITLIGGTPVIQIFQPSKNWDAGTFRRGIIW